tara:strand:+ start:1464 stop:2174 length:711 start_codon:yes stop_codon:yes gene_type:complete
MTTLNGNSTAINSKWLNLLKYKLKYKKTLIFVSIFFNSLAQATPITIHVNDSAGQPLEQAVIEVIRQNPTANSTGLSSEPAVMDQVNKRFLPDLILIKQGQSVVFPNSDNIRHHVYSFSKAKSFELKLYAGKPKKPVDFEDNGVVIVGCNIHDSMVGSIYVAKDSAMVTDQKGNVTLDFDPMIDKVSIWHPLQTNRPEERKIIKLQDEQFTDDKKGYVVSIDVAEPTARDTFGDTY